MSAACAGLLIFSRRYPSTAISRRRRSSSSCLPFELELIVAKTTLFPSDRRACRRLRKSILAKAGKPMAARFGSVTARGGQLAACGASSLRNDDDSIAGAMYQCPLRLTPDAAKRSRHCARPMPRGESPSGLRPPTIRTGYFARPDCRGSPRACKIRRSMPGLRVP